MKYFITLIVACGFVYAQDNTKGSIVSLNPGSPPQGVSALNFYDGSSNLIYRCQAVSTQPSYSWTRAATTLTSVAVSTNVGTVTTSSAHGLTAGNSVAIAGSTTAALNGTYKIATVGATTTFTITTAGVGDATYNNAAMTLSTTAPRSTAAIWSIHAYQYSGTNLTVEQWANGSTAMNKICDNRATISYQ